jgi:hypothetical protein
MTDRELQKQCEPLLAELEQIRGSKASANIARAKQIKDLLRLIAVEWSEIVQRKRRGEVTDRYAVDLVIKTAEPHVRLSGLPVVIREEEHVPEDGSHITEDYAVIVMNENRQPLTDDDDDADDEDAPESEADIQQRAADEKLFRQLTRMAIGITTEILEKDPAALEAINRPSHQNDALPVTDYFSVRALSRLDGDHYIYGLAIIWLPVVLPWRGYGPDVLPDPDVD